MDAREFIQIQIAVARRYCDAAIHGLTDAQFNWEPPGTANPIRATFLHIVGGEDRFVHTLMQGVPRLWETGEWAECIGLPMTPGGGGGWDEARATFVGLAPVLEYQADVRAATDAFLAGLTDADLRRTVDFPGGARPMADVWATLVAHILFHSGEVAAVKGAQGLVGLPF
jgi:hypothetical protein